MAEPQLRIVRNPRIASCSIIENCARIPGGSAVWSDTLRPERQQALGIPNGALRLHHPNVVDPAHRHPVLSAMWVCPGAASIWRI
jgi:hypothetical protein